MKNPVLRCCSECSEAFEPNPKVGDRQVTCGAPECQRARHCSRCRCWHARNADASAHHYADVVVPFRARQPDYQRRWRLGRRLGEIRETMQRSGSTLLAGFRWLLKRADKLAEEPLRSTQTGVLAGEMLDVARSALSEAIGAMARLEASMATLQALGA